MEDTENSSAILQQARDIVADAYIKAALARGIKPTNQATYESWGRHIDDYSKFLRSGAYDDDIAVVSTLTALRMVNA